ncbi:hypothetical protein, conserved [Eimeria necatrix]|uniref:Uncharacterized protein n=1 Tax=Eimeria necatrix TaxID=51315 RepID=U6N2A6_9EIME|nr:hypothetical protein, conserved [Eimeria necatrix]CDJ68045.1 hypothetical protein, conserved [Eimeria necatrix]
MLACACFSPPREVLIVLFAEPAAVLTFLESMFGVSSDVPSKMTTGTVASSHLRSCLPGDCAALTPVETPENRLKEKNSCKQFDLKHATCESLRCHSWDKRALLKELPHQSKYLRTVKPSSYSSTYSSDARHSAPSLPLPRRQETERKKAASKQTLRLAMRNEPQRQTALKENNDKQSKQENFSTSTIAAVCHQYKDQVQMQLEQRQTPSQKEQRDYAQLITASESTTSSPYCQMQRLENSFTQRAIGTSLRLAPKCTAAETTRTLKSSLQVAEQSEGNSSQQKGSPQLILPCQDLTGHINRVADEENNERNDGSFLRPAWAVALKVSNSLPIQKETEAADAAGLQLVRVTRGLWTNKEKEAHEFVEPGDTVPHVNSSTFSRVHSSSNADKGVPANAANKPGCFKNKGDTEGSRALSASDAFEWNSSITNIRHEGLSASVSHANCHANSKSVQFKVVKDKDQAFLAVRAIQQAEKEEAIRLLLLEASQNAVEKQAQKRNNEHQRQHQLLEYRLQDHDLSNTDGGKHQTCQSQRRQQSAASSSVGQHQARDPQFAQTAREVLPQPKGGALPKMNQAWSDATPLVHNNENIDTAVITQRHDSESKDIRRDNNVGMAEACSGMTARTLQSSRPKCNVRDKRQQLVVLNNGILERQQGLVRQFQEHYIKEQQGTLGSCRKQDCVERDLQSHTPLKVPSCTGGICLPLQTIRRHSTLQAFQQLFRLPSKTASNQRNLKKKYNFGADMEEVFLPAEIQKSIPTLRKGLSRR